VIAFARFPDNDEDDEKPPEHVLSWCRNLVETIADGGPWAIPRSQIIFRVDHAARKLILVVGETDAPDFIATKKVFKHIGWSVVGRE
jgi:hypothetical protein